MSKDYLFALGITVVCASEEEAEADIAAMQARFNSPYKYSDPRCQDTVSKNFS